MAFWGGWPALFFSRGSFALRLGLIALLSLSGLRQPGLSAEGALMIKDIARVGVNRDLELVGYGLVTGLRGTGDKAGSNPTTQSLVNMLTRLGVTVNAGDLNTSNVAAVAVTSRLSAFAQPGSAADGVVSSIGNATSLEGGTLLMTPLLAGNGKAYAVAQGKLSPDSLDLGDEKERKTGRATVWLSGGVQVNQPLPAPVVEDEQSLRVVLRDPNYGAAERVAQAIREELQTPARALDPSQIEVEVPGLFQKDWVAFAARVEHVPVQTEESPRVVVNEQTGTVIAGSSVKVSPVAIAHKGLKIEVEGGKAHPETSVTTLVSALDRVGVKPRDMVMIFKMLKRLGALKADLVFM